jgi:hypothetical protein
LTLWELITSVREQYLDFYRQTLQAQRPRLSGLAAEALLTVSNAPEDVPADYRTFRADMMWDVDGKPQIGALDGKSLASGPGCDPVTYPDGRQLRVARMRWDDCEFYAAPAVDADSAIRAWLMQWQDRAGSNPADDDGFHATVHSITPPGKSPDGNLIGFAVDFGTAPPEAFTSLVSALFGCGVTAIQIGSPPAEETGSA